MLGGRGWRFQWARVHWRLDDVRDVYCGHEDGTESALDLTLSFFEVVHHLKDWLVNDRSSGVTKAEGDALVDSSPVLKLCADLANGSKHLAQLGADAGAHRFYVQSGETEYDARAVAEAAVDAWTEFLTSKGLI